MTREEIVKWPIGKKAISNSGHFYQTIPLLKLGYTGRNHEQDVDFSFLEEGPGWNEALQHLLHHQQQDFAETCWSIAQPWPRK